MRKKLLFFSFCKHSILKQCKKCVVSNVGLCSTKTSHIFELSSWIQVDWTRIFWLVLYFRPNDLTISRKTSIILEMECITILTLMLRSHKMEMWALNSYEKSVVFYGEINSVFFFFLFFFYKSYMN